MEADAITPIEMTNTTGTKLNDLNEYCLLEIFSCTSLTPIDLCSLAETCKRFQQITQRVCAKDFDISRSSDRLRVRCTFKSMEYSKSYREHNVERILANFGHCLSTLSIGEGNQFVVNLVGKYCGDVTLKRLEIRRMTYVEGLRLQLKSLFQRLLALSIIDCHLLAASSYFNCDSLIELEIVDSTGCIAILNNDFPNLKRFTLRYHTMWPGRDGYYVTGVVSRFIGRHKLRVLHLDSMSVCLSEDLLDLILNSEELEELTLQSLKRERSLDVLNQKNLSSFRKLNVDITFDNYNHISALLQASTSLETIEITFVNTIPIRVFDVLSQQQHLRELTLNYYSFERIQWSILAQIRKLTLFTPRNAFGADLINIVSQLTNLEEFEFEDYWDRDEFVLAEGDFDRIVKIVERRPNVLTLKCRHRFTLSENCDRVKANAHKVRVFTLGLGASALHYLVEGVATAGGGTAVFVDYNESMDKKVINQLKNALQPSLFNVTIKWNESATDDVPELNTARTLIGYNKPIETEAVTSESRLSGIKQSPKKVRPIFDGSQLLVFGIFKNGGPKSVLITAHTPDGPLTLRIKHSPSNNLDGNGNLLHRLAAIKLIRELEMEVSALQSEHSEAEKILKNEIIEIACQNGIASRYTSFIATDVRNDKQSEESWVMVTRHVPSQIAHGSYAIMTKN
ncbi:uncharacterized protein LOC119075459 [Bradysia coprophila]|uniref:uncharacterized protein LOC119075459 n=1 Tax=Bradysia coprophila TaxID=38358 RepID=UPI00187DA0FD|nr:uncharacterized protein LOC119075459 [Bradysia coprophila]